VVGFDPYDVEGDFTGHAGVGSGAWCDGEGVVGLRPGDGNGGVVSGFVVVTSMGMCSLR